MTLSYKRLHGLIRAVLSGLVDVSPVDPRSQQQRLEAELFTHCDGLGADEVGLHWVYDWLFGLDRTFSLAVGRVMCAEASYTHVSFRSEPPRVSRRPFGLSHAAMTDGLSMA